MVHNDRTPQDVLSDMDRWVAGDVIFLDFWCSSSRSFWLDCWRAGVGRPSVCEVAVVTPRKVPIDPEVLTPAGQRAVRDITRRFTIVFLVFGLFVAGAFTFYVNNTQSSGKCFAKQYAWDEFTFNNKQQSKQLTLDGFTGQVLLARQLANASRKSNFDAEKKQLGDRPSC